MDYIDSLRRIWDDIDDLVLGSGEEAPEYYTTLDALLVYCGQTIDTMINIKTAKRNLRNAEADDGPAPLHAAPLVAREDHEYANIRDTHSALEYIEGEIQANHAELEAEIQALHDRIEELEKLNKHYHDVQQIYHCADAGNIEDLDKRITANAQRINVHWETIVKLQGTTNADFQKLNSDIVHHDEAIRSMDARTTIALERIRGIHSNIQELVLHNNHNHDRIEVLEMDMQDSIHRTLPDECTVVPRDTPEECSCGQCDDCEAYELHMNRLNLLDALAPPGGEPGHNWCQFNKPESECTPSELMARRLWKRIMEECAEYETEQGW